MRKAERERLFGEARRKDVLRELWDVQPILSNLETTLEDENNLTFRVVFDDGKTREDQSKKFWDYISNELFPEGFDLRPEKRDDVIVITLSGKVTKDDIYFCLDSIFGNRFIHFSQAFLLELNGRVVLKTLCSEDYSKYLGSEYIFFNVVKRPYKGRTSYGISIREDEQKVFIRNILLSLFCLKEECPFGVGVKKLLYEGSKGRELAFEKMVPLGKEDHLHWRVNGKKIGIIDSEKRLDDILTEIIKKDGICFYPKISQKVNGIEIPTKLVFEMDPRRETLRNAWIASQYLVEVLERLHIPYLLLHSGSKSCRAEVFLDGRAIMEKSEELLEEFPFIGKVSKKSLEDEKVRYRAICKTLQKAIFIYIYNLMRDKELGDVRFNLTMNKFSIGRYILFDLPPTVSIGEGSPKTLVDISEIYKYNDGYKDLNRAIRYGFTLCTPIRREEIPESKEDIYRITNFLSASQRIEKYYKIYVEQMNKRIMPRELADTFGKIPQRQFDILCVKGERKFKKLYPIT